MAGAVTGDVGDRLVEAGDLLHRQDEGPVFVSQSAGSAGRSWGAAGGFPAGAQLHALGGEGGQSRVQRRRGGGGPEQGLDALQAAG